MTSFTQQDLRLAVKDLHDIAETTQLAKDLISGNIDPNIYRNLCYQLWLITDAIERQLKNLDHRICRRHKFAQDLSECVGGKVRAMPATIEYVDYINSMFQPCISGQLKGAVYCFYLGYLYGGQIIAKKLTLPTNHLQFVNVKECVDYIRQQLLCYIDQQELDEARIAFRYIIKIYQELYELH